MKKLILAIPKGRILDELNPLLSRVGIIPEPDFFNEKSRKLIFNTNLSNLEIVKVRSFDVATFVKFGVADLGVCGFDVLEEFTSPEIFSVLDLGIGRCRLSIAGNKYDQLNFDKETDFDVFISNSSHIKIATKYTEIAKRYFSNYGIQAEVIKLNGSIEIAPKLGLCSYILDLVSSGKTLEENNMFELKKVLEVSSYLVVNRASLKTNHQLINKIIKIFDEKK